MRTVPNQYSANNKCMMGFNREIEDTAISYEFLSLYARQCGAASDLREKEQQGLKACC